MRLIDADALGEKLLVTTIFIKAGAVFQRMISDAPTIDAVQVVRCKDCKHSDHWYRDKCRCFLWCENGIDVFNDGFCNYGERSE